MFTNMIMFVFAIDILSLLSANMTLIRASFLARRDNATLPWTSQVHCRSPSSTGQSGTDVSSAGRTAASPPRAPPSPSKRVRSSCKRRLPLRTHPGGYGASFIIHFRELGYSTYFLRNISAFLVSSVVSAYLKTCYFGSLDSDQF